MKVHLSDLKPGDKLAQDAFNRFGLLVLSKGAVVSHHELVLLYRHRLEYLEIDQRASQPPAAAQADNYKRVQAKLMPKYEDAVAGLEQIFAKALAEGKVYEEDLQTSFQPLVDNCKAQRDVVSLLLMLNNRDDYTYQHSVQVGMLGYYIARWLGWDDARAVQAGKAGFLHDIGKCRIPEAILNKPGKLTQDEYKEVQNHARYGYEILQRSTDDRVIQLAALQHHERLNGTGYPDGIGQEQIHPVSRIVAVADTYSAMISTRVYQEKRDLLFVLKELHRASFGLLDPTVTHTFIRRLLPNFLGKRLELADGTAGMIVMNHPTDFFRPLILTENGRFIDLYANRDFEIRHVYL